MNNKRRKIISVTLISLIIFMSTYKLMIASYIRSLFQQEGLENIELYVESTGFGRSTMKDILIGDSKTMAIGEANIGYSISDLLNHRVDSIVLKKAVIEAEIVNNKLSVHGLDSFIKDFTPKNSSVLLPGYLFDSQSFIFNSLVIENSKIHFKKEGVDIWLPFNLSIKKDKEIELTFNIDTISGTAWEYLLSSENISGSLKLENNEIWKGEWKANILPKNKNQKVLPKLNANGNIAFSNVNFDTKFNVVSVPSLIKVDAQIQLLNKNSSITFNELSMPFAGGTVGVKKMTIPFSISRTINFNLECNNLSTQQVMSLVLGGSDVIATGEVSGTLPMAITRKGDPIFYSGSLNSEDNAFITISPDLIPPDNKDLLMLRKALGRYDYDRLAIELESGEKDSILFNIVFLGDPESANKKQPASLNIRIHNNLMIMLDKIASQINPSSNGK